MNRYQFISRSDNSEAAGAAEYNFTPPIDGGAKRPKNTKASRGDAEGAEMSHHNILPIV